jgi:hypothetical protein
MRRTFAKSIMGTNSEFVAERIHTLNIPELSQEQRKTMTAQQVRYRIVCQGLAHTVHSLREQISGLERKAEEERPFLPGADFIHTGMLGCGLKTAYNMGSDNEGGAQVYYCAFCKKDFQNDDRHIAKPAPRGE